MSHVTVVQTKPGEFEFRLPDIGEGVVEGEVVKWLVNEGDTVSEDQPIVEIMTDKATVEIPSPKTGVIAKRFWAEGQTCPVGQALVLIKATAEAGGEVAHPPAQIAPAGEATDAHPGAKAEPQATATAPKPGANGHGNGSGAKALAAPATRKLARDLGVELNQVPATGPHGRVTRDDVQRAAAGGTSAPTAAPRVAAAAQPVTTTGDVERIPLRGLRRKIAEKMVQSAFTAPHVTTFDEVDMTELVALRGRIKAKAEAQGVKLSYLPFIFKAVIAALKQFPMFNASLDETTQEVVVKKYYHLGFAAATDAGLMVPVVKHADTKSLMTIAKDIQAIAGRTRDGKAPLDELTGSTFTVSNVGSLGGLFATPIINYPEVAILGVNKIQKRPVVVGDSVQVRDMMYLGLSFDHRVIDGAEAVQFLNTVIGYLQDPELLLMEL